MAKKILIALLLAISVFVLVQSSQALVVVPPGPVIGSQSYLPTGTINQPYPQQTIQVSGGIAPYTWSVIAGALPPGIILNSTTGVLSGTPTSTGNFIFTAQVTDANAAMATQEFNLTIAPVSQTGFVYTRTPSGSPVVSPFTIRIQGVFGIDLCANVAGATDYWISYSNVDRIDSFLPRTPHIQGNIIDDTFQVSLSPNTYSTRLECWRDGHPHAGFNLEAGLVIVPPTPTITTPLLDWLPTGTTNQIYPQQIFQASGGIPPYSWDIISGSLPFGLALSTAGVISGTPINTGNFNFTIRVTDANSATGTKNLNLTIAPVSQTGFVYTRTPSGSTIVSPATIRIQGVFGVDLCANVVGSNAYWLAFSNIDRIDTFTSVVNHAQGDIVDDIFRVSLSPNTYTVRLECWRDGHPHAGFNLEGDLTIPTIAIITSNLTNGLVGEPYSQILKASGGTSPLTWVVVSGLLPSGLSLNSSAGEIFGTPTTVETANFAVRVTDANNNVATKDLSITVHGNTPIGSDVVVGPLSGVTLTFSQVTQEGQTTVASSSSGTQPPSGFKLGSPPTYYNISTTAQFIPQVEICINYNDTQFRNENSLKLMHFENGQWVNVTTSLDTINNIICGEVSSFSELALFENLNIDYIIDEVKDFNFDEDIEQGLLDKLTAAKSALERDKTKTAINILKAFTNQIKAQKNKKITNEQADRLLADVNEFIEVLSGDSLFATIKLILSDL